MIWGGTETIQLVVGAEREEQERSLGLHEPRDAAGPATPDCFTCSCNVRIMDDTCLQKVLLQMPVVRYFVRFKFLNVHLLLT